MHQAPVALTGRVRQDERLPVEVFDPAGASSMPSNRRPPTLEHLAAARRTELAKHWPAAAQVEQTLGDEPGGPAQSAMQWFCEGRLLAAYLPDAGGSWRFPPWQFRKNGKPVQYLADVLGMIRSTDLVRDARGRTSGWAEIEWFLAGHALLGGCSPAELLATSPHQVLRAAVAEFGSES